MAEIFGAVASGAGLLSLAIQLLESSQKLKSFYTTSRDAPQTVADLFFELETLSLSLRQLSTHRRSDTFSDEPLGRCIMTCTRMVTRIQAAVTKIEHVLQKSRGLGRMYTAFKEPEIQRLLEDLEHAKSSILLAYMSYCQSCDIRESSIRTTEAQLQSAILLSHEAHLQSLGLAIQSGHAAILKRIEANPSPSPDASSRNTLTTHKPGQEYSSQTLSRKPLPQTIRLALPRWLSTFVWEFAIQKVDHGWNLGLRPINVRQEGSFAFEVVRSGDVRAVKKLLMLGELSASDCETYWDDPRNMSLLRVAAECGRLELCEFLLQEFPMFRSDDNMHDALKGVLERNTNRVHRVEYDQRDYDDTPDAFYELFLGTYGFGADLCDSSALVFPHPKNIPMRYEFEKREDVAHSLLLTDSALQKVLSSQLIPFTEWPLPKRLDTALNSRGWPAESFVRLANADTIEKLARYTDAQGRTVLHWAAEHFGYWMSHADHRASQEDDERRSKEYSELMVRLITHGADMHAKNSTDETPFVCMLRGPYPGLWNWRSENLCAAIERWGHILQEMDISLPAFAEVENRNQARNAASKLRVTDMNDIWTYRLVVVEELTLAIELGASLQCPIWEYRPPPGLWTTSKYHIDRITWDPRPDEEDSYLWQASNTPQIRLAPTLLRPPKTPSSFTRSVIRSWRDYICGAQDDHGFVATTERRRFEREFKRSCRHRSASLPRPATMLDGSNYLAASKDLIWDWDHWMAPPHICPFSLTWVSPYQYHRDSLRRCMRGRCDEPDFYSIVSDHWQATLLDDEDNIELAKRFTGRFNPGWLGILKERHKRAQRWSEIGITGSDVPKRNVYRM